ncbi:hypothetical protein [Prochlorococcus sp. MIT 1223]|uniref:hypothetical protein n=1 Tax=Prochlorococcus sp. MIT 1223 TaxID=3096217 RepID=UPI002A75E7E9|nr:hypothetical protein [Prochlorococcus sp. MIT 1223]
MMVETSIFKVATDPQNASDPRSANHHWFPFLRYQEQCEAEGKEATVNGWLRSTGKLQHQLEYEELKAQAASSKQEEKTADE